MSTTPPPGWYRDPAAPHTERWWGGTAWTDHWRTPSEPPAVTETPSETPSYSTSATPSDPAPSD
ncbi:DUF2510 domain-containing protein, partial [Streptomyces sp. NPDC002156]